MTPIEDEYAEISTLGMTQKYSLSDLGLLSHVGSSAFAINNQGDVIGTLGSGDSDAFSPQANHSFLWRKGEIVDFGRSLAVTGINDNRQMIGIEYPLDFDLNMMLKVNPIFCSDTEWRNILPTRAAFGFPVALNNMGQVVGQVCLRQPRKEKKSFLPAIWNHEMSQLLKVPSFYNSGRVKGINDAGQAVGSLQKVSENPASLRNHAVLWENEGVTRLGTLPGLEESEAIAINTKGQVLCVATYGSAEFGEYVRQLWEGSQPLEARSLVFGGFIYDGGKTTALMTSDDSAVGIDVAKGCLPRAINDNSVVVGRATDLQGETIAFVWQNHQMLDLNTLVPSHSGWTLAEAKGINNSGQIVGQGKYNGRSHAFLLTPQE